MKRTTVLAKDIKVGDLLAPESYDCGARCSPVKVTSIAPYGTSHHSLIILGEWEWKGKTYTSESDNRHLVFVKTQEVIRLGIDMSEYVTDDCSVLEEGLRFG